MNEHFEEIDLRPERPQTLAQEAPPRPHSTSKLHQRLGSVLKRTFTMKKRRLTTPVTENELSKENISSPTNLSRLPENDIQLGSSSIQSCPFDITGYGEFLLMDEFRVKKPKAMALMVFLFEKILIFTKKQPNEDVYYYIGKHNLDQLSIMPPKKNKRILELKDHASTLRFHKEVVLTLEAPSEYIQVQWRKAIEKCLWAQFMKVKRGGGL